MKKAVLLLSMTSLLLISGLNKVMAQELPKPKKDTVNMDTDAKPQFYYPVEDEKAAESSKKGSTTTIIIIAGAVVVLGGAGFFLLKKKK